jgi:hypothetical protein
MRELLASRRLSLLELEAFMAIIVNCRDGTAPNETLGQISMAIDKRKVPDWIKGKGMFFLKAKGGDTDTLCFSPTISGERLIFGLVNSSDPEYSISREVYDAYHASFYDALVHLSWLYYFTVELTPDRLENIDARISG